MIKQGILCDLINYTVTRCGFLGAKMLYSTFAVWAPPLRSLQCFCRLGTVITISCPCNNNLWKISLWLRKTEEIFIFYFVSMRPMLQAHYSTGRVAAGFTSTVMAPETSHEAGLDVFIHTAATQLKSDMIFDFLTVKIQRLFKKKLLLPTLSIVR